MSNAWDHDTDSYNIIRWNKSKTWHCWIKFHHSLQKLCLRGDWAVRPEKDPINAAFFSLFSSTRIDRSDKSSSLHVQLNSITITEREGINQIKKPLHLLITENWLGLRGTDCAISRFLWQWPIPINPISFHFILKYTYKRWTTVNMRQCQC